MHAVMHLHMFFFKFSFVYRNKLSTIIIKSLKKQRRLIFFGKSYGNDFSAIFYENYNYKSLQDVGCMWDIFLRNCIHVIISTIDWYKHLWFAILYAIGNRAN